MTNKQQVPVLPYAGTSGHSGSEASRERAERDDKSGRTAYRQATVLKRLGQKKSVGLTWKEMDELTGWNHHGRTTGALSAMHKAGLIVRLTEKRNRCSVYVLPEWTKGRPTAPHGRKKTDDCPTCEGMAVMYESLLAEFNHWKAQHAL